MDITKLPAPEIGAPGVATPAEQGAKALLNLAATADRVDIRPLDISAALQILIAEVRASFDIGVAGVATPGVATPGATAPGASVPGAAVDNPLQTARALMEII